MIIIGYPGVGKTEAAKRFVEVIDLESSIVKSKNGLTLIDYPLECYCNFAEYLSKQGYIVCVSSHKEVQKYFLKSTEQVYICYPQESIREYWVHNLRQRYLQNPDDKNLKALERVVDNFEEDLVEMKHSGFDKIELPQGVFLFDVIMDSIKREQQDRENGDVLVEDEDTPLEDEDVSEGNEE